MLIYLFLFDFISHMTSYVSVSQSLQLAVTSLRAEREYRHPWLLCPFSYSQSMPGEASCTIILMDAFGVLIYLPKC